MRPAELRKKADMELVGRVMSLTQASDYCASFNPFEAGTLRHERFEPHYKRELQSFRNWDKEFESLVEIYGEFRPDKLGLVPERRPWQLLSQQEKDEKFKCLLRNHQV